MTRTVVAALLLVASVVLVTVVMLSLVREDSGLEGWSEPDAGSAEARVAPPPGAPDSAYRPPPAPRIGGKPKPGPVVTPEAAPAPVVPVPGPTPPPRRPRVAPSRGPGSVRGSVVDQSGVSVEGAIVWIYSGDADRSSTRTNERGIFEFSRLPLGRHRIEVEPATGEKRSTFAVTGVNVRLEEHAAVARPRIVVNRGLFVYGRVVGPDRKPLAGVPVVSFGSRDDLFGEMGLGTETRRDGTFVLGPLRPGLLMVQADGSDGLADSAPQTVAAGAAGVVLRLPKAASLTGVATCAGREGRASCEVRAYKRERWVWERTWTARRCGSFEFPELEPGVYDLVAADAAGNVVVRPGVRVAEGACIENVTLRLVRGGRLALRIECPDLGPRLDEAPHKWMVSQHGATVYSARANTERIGAVVPAGPARVRLVRLTDNVVVGERGVSALPGRPAEVSIALP